MCDIARAHWNPSTLKLQYDAVTSKVIVTRGPQCDDCSVLMPQTIRFTLSNFVDSCDCVFENDTARYMTTAGIAAAVNNNTYDAVWDGIIGSRCQWDNYTNPAGGGFGQVDFYLDAGCEVHDETVTFDSLIVEVSFNPTTMNWVQVRLEGSDALLHDLFWGDITYDTGQCDACDGETFSNKWTDCGGAICVHPCAATGNVKLDFIY